jgi:ABC-2 type transport system permease protein
MARGWAVLWAQWRIYRNYASGAPAALGAVIGILWYGIWAAAGVAAGVLMAQPDAATLTGPVSAALLLVSLYWQLIPLMLAASGVALDLGKLKAYPIPVRELFGIEVMLRATAAGEMLLVLTGAAVGVALNPSLPAWCALAALPFAAFHLLLGLGVRDILTRLLSRRRIRELVALAIVTVFTLPRLIWGGDGGAARWLARQFRDGEPSWDVAWLPWTAAGHWLTGQDAMVSVAALFGWTAVALGFAVWQFRRTLRFDAEAAGATGGVQDSRRGGSVRLWRLPSLWLPDPLGILVEKEVRYLVRAPRFRILFLMACALGSVIPRAVASPGTPEWAPSGLSIATAYAVLVLGEVCVWNSFGFDRSAAQLYLLAPVRFSRVIGAKNLAGGACVALQIGVLALLHALLGVPVGVAQLGEAAGCAAVVLPLLWSAGNYISVRSPRPAHPESSMRSRASGGMQAVLVFLYPLTLAPVALAYFARWAFGSPGVFFGVLSVMAGVAWIIYVVALHWAADYAEAHKEHFVAALSAGQGPLVS